MHTGEYKWCKERTISFDRNKRDEIKIQNMKRIRLLRKYNTEKKENLDKLIEELKQKVSTKTQWLLWYGKRQNQYYQNKMFRTDCK